MEIKVGDKFQVLDDKSIKFIKNEIEDLNDLIQMRNEVPFYDPDDVITHHYEIDDILMALEYLADTELEVVQDNYFLTPTNIIYVKGNWGIGGIHSDMLELVANKLNISLPPTLNKCTHSNKYKNVISKALSFWVCRDCGEEVK